MLEGELVRRRAGGEGHEVTEEVPAVESRVRAAVSRALGQDASAWPVRPV